MEPFSFRPVGILFKMDSFSSTATWKQHKFKKEISKAVDNCVRKIRKKNSTTREEKKQNYTFFSIGRIFKFK